MLISPRPLWRGEWFDGWLVRSNGFRADLPFGATVFCCLVLRGTQHQRFVVLDAGRRVKVRPAALGVALGGNGVAARVFERLFLSWMTLTHHDFPPRNPPMLRCAGPERRYFP